MAQGAFTDDIPCPACARVIRRAQVPEPRLHRAALMVWLAIIPVSVLWALVIMALCAMVGVFLGFIGLSVVAGMPAVVMVFLAMQLPRVRVVRCRYCGWSQTKVLSRGKA